MQATGFAIVKCSFMILSCIKQTNSSFELTSLCSPTKKWVLFLAYLNSFCSPTETWPTLFFYEFQAAVDGRWLGILRYHYEVGRTIKGTLKEDWSSFGVLIGADGTKVLSWSIVKVEDSTVACKIVPVPAAPPLRDAILTASLLFIHKILVVKHRGTAQYIDQILWASPHAA